MSQKAGSTTKTQNFDQEGKGNTQNNIKDAQNTSLSDGKDDKEEKQNTQQQDPDVKKIQTKFQSTSLREYYDSSNLTLVLTKGLEELGRMRPQNPIRFLADFLLENDPQK